MFELTVCSDGMTEVKPRSSRQNRPASEYIIRHNARTRAKRTSNASYSLVTFSGIQSQTTSSEGADVKSAFMLP